MKTKFTFLFIFITGLFLKTAFTQTAGEIVPDARLYQCYDSSYIAQLQTINPNAILYYNYYLEHAYYTVELQKPKPVTGEDIHNVTLNEDLSKGTTVYFDETSYAPEKFNVLKYAFKTHDTNFITYVWKEADIAIVFLPRKKIAEGYQKYLKDNNIQ
jgi:hypothetical protein